MEITYQHSEDDLRKNYRGVVKNRAKIRHNRRWIAVIVIIAIITCIVYLLITSSIVTIIMLCMLIPLVTYNIESDRRIFVKLIQESKGQQNITVEITPEHIKEATLMYSLQMDWLYIKRIINDESCIYLYTTSYSSIMIPKRAFANDGEANHFLLQANKYWSDARLINNKVDEDLSSLSSSDEKECPMCAERVKMKAKVCRYCSYEFK